MKKLIFLLVTFSLSLTISFGQGKLQKSEESLNEKQSTRSNHRNSGQSGSSNGNFLADTFGYVIVALKKFAADTRFLSLVKKMGVRE